MLLNNHIKQSPIIGLAGLGGGISSYVFLSAGGAYEIARSLRFDSNSSAYLDKTFGSAGSRTTWTWSAWIKRQDSGSEDVFTAASGGAGANCGIFFSSGDQLLLNLGDQLDSGNGLAIKTTQVFRDFSAWYHVVAVVDTTNGTQSDRLRLYVNGVRVTNLATTLYPGPSEAGGFINSGEVHNIGRRAENNTQYFNGYLADIWFIDGQALEPTAFGEFDTTTGVWNPKRYTGAKSGNSFHLPFSDNTSTTTLGYDDSGNNNNWTLNNIAASALNYADTATETSTSGYTPSTDPNYYLPNLFDGNTGTYWTIATSGNHNVTATFSPKLPSGTTIEIFGWKNSSNTTGVVEVNGTDVSSLIDANGPGSWADVSSAASGGIQTIKLYRIDGVKNPALTGIRVDGTVIVDIAASDIDTLLDSPSNDTDTGTGIGGEITGNYATLNPLAITSGANSPTNGNLDWSRGGSQSYGGLATIAPSTGKWYWECTVTTVGDTNYGVGMLYAGAPASQRDGQVGASYGALYQAVGRVLKNGSDIGGTYASYTTGDVIGVAYDADALSVTFYKNNTAQPAVSLSSPTSAYAPWIFLYVSSAAVTCNFGQRDFAYDAPTGYKALNTAALPTPTIARPDEYVGIATYTGNGGTQSISSLNLQPDLVWIKDRDGTNNHMLYDSVRGSDGKNLIPNSTAIEGAAGSNDLTGYTSNGFTLGSNNAVNSNTVDFVSWCWKAGGAPTTDNVAGAGNVPTAGSAKIDDANMTTTLAGSIAATRLSANTSAGFSIATFTAPSSGTTFTVGHGLNVTPSFVIVKGTGAVSEWITYHADVITATNQYLALNSTAAIRTYSTIWGTSLPTSTVVGLTADGGASASAASVMYSFAPVEGYSAFGSYTGNGSTDGPFVYTGHRPKFLLVKASTIVDNWKIVDTERDSYNVAGTLLLPSASNAEIAKTGYEIDICSNGFKVRNATSAFNSNTQTYIFASFAESPFPTQARAR